MVVVAVVVAMVISSSGSRGSSRSSAGTHNYRHLKLKAAERFSFLKPFEAFGTMQILKIMLEEIAASGRFLKRVMQEAWLVAVVVAGFEYFGAGPGGFLACVELVLRLTVLKRVLNMKAMLCEMAWNVQLCAEKLTYMEKRLAVEGSGGGRSRRVQAPFEVR